jgi:hypothetical protein
MRDMDVSVSKGGDVEGNVAAYLILSTLRFCVCSMYYSYRVCFSIVTQNFRLKYVSTDLEYGTRNSERPQKPFVSTSSNRLNHRYKFRSLGFSQFRWFEVIERRGQVIIQIFLNVKIHRCNFIQTRRICALRQYKRNKNACITQHFSPFLIVQVWN